MAKRSTQSTLFSEAQITLGTKPGFVQLAFPDKPSQAERDTLKGAGFRFNPQSFQWWGHRDRAAQWGLALPSDTRKSPKGKRVQADQPKRRGSPKAEAEVVASGHGVNERLDKLLEAMLGLNSKVEAISQRLTVVEAAQGLDEAIDD